MLKDILFTFGLEGPSVALQFELGATTVWLDVGLGRLRLSTIGVIIWKLVGAAMFTSFCLRRIVTYLLSTENFKDFFLLGEVQILVESSRLMV